MEYIVDGRKFVLSYTDLREDYYRFTSMTDEEFMKNIPVALHFACVVCFLKEVPTYVALSDKGIIHELVHLLHIPDGNTTTLREIRDLFRDALKLA